MLELNPFFDLQEERGLRRVSIGFSGLGFPLFVTRYSGFFLFETRDSGFSLFKTRDSGFSLFKNRDSGFPLFETWDSRFSFLKLGIWDLEAKSGQVSGLKVCSGGGMPKITLGIAGVPKILGRD